MANVNSEPSLRGFTAVVTGGSGGIGRAICDELFENGCRVIVIYHEHDSNADQVVRSIRDRGGESAAFCVDVSRFDAVQEVFGQILDQYGKIDILINCAGITKDRTMLKMTIDEWNEVIDVNLTGAFNCSKAAIDSMRKNNFGRVVNITSVVALAGNFGQTNYCASKAGLIGMTKAMALETARFDITVNAVAPGFTETSMTMRIPEKILVDIMSRIPKGRLCKPIEIAKAVLFLCSPGSSYITGHVLGINGGYYMQ